MLVTFVSSLEFNSLNARIGFINSNAIVRIVFHDARTRHSVARFFFIFVFQLAAYCNRSSVSPESKFVPEIVELKTFVFEFYFRIRILKKDLRWTLILNRICFVCSLPLSVSVTMVLLFSVNLVAIERETVSFSVK